MSKYTEMEFDHIGHLVAQLVQYGAPTDHVEAWLERAKAKAHAGPTEADLRWPVEPQDTVTDHLAMNATVDARPALSCRLVTGRQYSLTPAQRDVIRDWFDMTPAPTIKVVAVSLHEGTQAVKHVHVVSCEHVDPRRRAMLTQFSITKWGEFCDKVRQREHERAEEAAALADEESSTPKASRVGTKPTAPKKPALLTTLMTEYGVD